MATPIVSKRDPKSAAVDVLLVDDNEGNLVLLETMLEDLGQNIVSKTSGEEALAYLKEHEVAVILLDVRMPILDGLETATLIRQRESSKHTPIIFHTAAIPHRSKSPKPTRWGPWTTS